MAIKRRWLLAIMLVTVSIATMPSARAADLVLTWLDPTGKVVAQRELELSDLDAFDQKEIFTTTLWNSAPRRFAGPELLALSEMTGLKPIKAELQALNDYSVEVPKEDWLNYELILSSRIDGKAPRIYEKGPYWLIYNVDKLPKPTPQLFISRMIWQVHRIQFYVD